ncbi:MAG: 6,7-dimethyl-8-ribityllumazine synthase [Verrucomicrobiota bacterium]
MSVATLPRRPRSIGPKRTIAIVASLYNSNYVNGLVDACNEELIRIYPSAAVPLYRVPGAFEIPVCVKYVVDHGAVDVVIALGVVIRGETAHGDLVGTSVAQSLQDIAVESKIPIIHEVLLCDTEAQADVRCLNPEYNRGIEAARAAVNMAELFYKLHSMHPEGKPSVVNG